MDKKEVKKRYERVQKAFNEKIVEIGESIVITEDVKRELVSEMSRLSFEELERYLFETP